MANFIPADHQNKFNVNKWIIQETPNEEEAVPMDVLFVGAGPAGLAGAIELSNLVKRDPDLGDIEIGVLEKAENLGGHCLSGAVINPRSLHELFPGMPVSEFPFKKQVTKDSTYFIASEDIALPIPTPPTMHNKGNYVASLCEVVRWLGEKAEEQGVNIFNSFPADSLLVDDQDKVIGVRTTPAGLDRDSKPGPQHMPPTDVTAQITVLTEGTRGPLTQAFLEWQQISSRDEQIYALGVKELWKVKKPLDRVTHTLGWPLDSDTFGGSFMYPMDDEHVSLGLVVGLDYKRHDVDVHEKLQKLKTHPLFKKHLEGGECVEWGAKTIPEGGYHALPNQLHGDGLLIAGDAAGFVNVPAIKGIHYAIKSGIEAARTAYEALKAKDASKNQLKSYDKRIKNSFINDDLYEVRNMRQAFKSGLYTGGIKSALMIATKGAFPGDDKPHQEDAKTRKYTESTEEKTKGISKVDAVYLSGNKTRDDIPQHLTVGKDITPEIADFYTHLCPAGVYERDGDTLTVNAPNCIDCKATDVLGPRWQPREGGAGPDYQNM